MSVGVMEDYKLRDLRASHTPHQVLSLANSADNPSETPLSTWKTELLEENQMRFKGLG